MTAVVLEDIWRAQEFTEHLRLMQNVPICVKRARPIVLDAVVRCAFVLANAMPYQQWALTEKPQRPCKEDVAAVQGSHKTRWHIRSGLLSGKHSGAHS